MMWLVLLLLVCWGVIAFMRLLGSTDTSTEPVEERHGVDVLDEFDIDSDL